MTLASGVALTLLDQVDLGTFLLGAVVYTFARDFVAKYLTASTSIRKPRSSP